MGIKNVNHLQSKSGETFLDLYYSDGNAVVRHYSRLYVLPRHHNRDRHLGATGSLSFLPLMHSHGQSAANKFRIPSVPILNFEPKLESEPRSLISPHPVQLKVNLNLV